MTALFLAVQEATEEAIYNAILKAITVIGMNRGKREAININQVVDILKKYNVLDVHFKFPP